ncbi:hypothetical protein NC653_001429 [Populus alba x Populus x berolinensis]|uniref:Uncharacterized protein n=1 Tax=Populus alba x Populus x berolinensis TaxID=444605 RepID=A0AAD6RMD5_9ROSI|nr:hypothetical protein NC653_001429 [Populus alba x Populus x berolinensis]
MERKQTESPRLDACPLLSYYCNATHIFKKEASRGTSSEELLLAALFHKGRALFEAFWIGSLIILSTFKRVVDFASRPARKGSSVLSIGIRERKEKKSYSKKK